MSDGVQQKLRVAILFDNFGPYHIARLAAAAQTVDVIAIEVAARSYEYAWEPAETEAFRRVTLFPAGVSEERSNREMAQAVIAALDGARPQVLAVPGWSDRAGLVALGWARRNKVPAIVMSASNLIDRRRHFVTEFVKRRIVSLFSAGIVGGTLGADYLSALGMPRDRIASGYDVVDNDHFEQGSKAALADPVLRAGLGLPERYFLCSARFVKKKNLPGLIDAYAQYRAGVGASAWSLVVIGDGPLRPELEERISALGLDRHVLLPGFIQYGDLPKYYGLASAFILPSAIEQWGLVVNEAMASGLPVIVSARCGCAPDLIVEGANGFKVDPADRAMLASRMASIATGETAQSMGVESRAIIARWTPQLFADELRRLAEIAYSRPRRRGSVLGTFFVSLWPTVGRAISRR
ncbi:glycosyltransferase [Sphingomonas immobilis]|uniref:Glycosyltransferase n=1 Tax=Sphingomonas immobilis TaxID=3063997 RepID=A0ABT8ZVA0_9SPHN|nr:glycosyltransferase [Sphingomonas sp. CA1-15]MDO7840920.1 glycosyltransferase [Sphingomonas sp. CA1-15]